MSLSTKALDHLMGRLTAVYGRDFKAQWEGHDFNAVRSVWADVLDCYADNLHAIAWALERLPERPPNAIGFRNLCRSAPVAEKPRLTEPKADPARVAEALAALAPLRTPAATIVDHKAWAKKIIEKKNAGAKFTPTVLKMAVDVCGVYGDVT